MPRLNSEQQAVLGRILAIGRRVGATPKEIKAAVETGLVESNLSNPRGGDADSAGWRQERSSLYKDPTNLDASIHRFFSETAAVRDRYGNSGALAATARSPERRQRCSAAAVAAVAVVDRPASPARAPPPRPRPGPTTRPPASTWSARSCSTRAPIR
jgi:hypothetical protein